MTRARRDLARRPNPLPLQRAVKKQCHPQHARSQRERASRRTHTAHARQLEDETRRRARRHPRQNAARPRQHQPRRMLHREHCRANEILADEKSNPFAGRAARERENDLITDESSLPVAGSAGGGESESGAGLAPASRRRRRRLRRKRASASLMRLFYPTPAHSAAHIRIRRALVLARTHQSFA